MVKRKQKKHIRTSKKGKKFVAGKGNGRKIKREPVSHIDYWKGETVKGLNENPDFSFGDAPLNEMQQLKNKIK